MFKEEYQGGTHVEIFTVNAREPLKDWKVTDSGSFDKVYEKDAKGFILNVRGSTGTTHVQLPKDPKQNLFLIQPFFVVQVNVPRLSDFYVELTVRDVRGTRRRLFFSSNQKEVASTALHARLPLSGLQSNVWTNLCIDLPSFVSHCWPSSVFHSVASILLAGTFKLRKIFTLKVPPPPSTYSDDQEPVILPIDKGHAYEHLPKNCDFPIEVVHITQVVSIASVQKQISSAPPNSGRGNNLSIALSNNLVVTGISSAIPLSSSRVALSAGEKMPEPPPSAKRKSSVVRRVVVSGPCESSVNGADLHNGLCISGTSSKSVDTVKSYESASASGISRTRKQPEVESARKAQTKIVKSLSQKSADMSLPKVDDHPKRLPHIETVALPSDKSKRRGSLTESVCDAIDLLNDEMDMLLVAKNSSIPGVVDREDTGLLVSSSGRKSDVPKLPAVRQTYSLVAAEQIVAAPAIKNNGSLLRANKKLPDELQQSFGIEDNISDDEGVAWSVINDNYDVGPQLCRDFELDDSQGIDHVPKVAENPRTNGKSPLHLTKGTTPPLPYDAKRYTSVEKGNENATKISIVEPGNGALREEPPNNNKSSETQISVASEQSEVELLFDPVLNCYYDPKTGKYFELI